MNKNELRKLLNGVKENNITVESALDSLKKLPYEDLGFAKIDNHRQLRQGYPEVIYCASKTTDQVYEIFKTMVSRGNNVIGTRATEEMYNKIKKICPQVRYDPLSKMLTVKQKIIDMTNSHISVVTGGTSDIPVAEEAAITSEMLGNKVERVYDVGVAGIHRLLDNLDIIMDAKVIIAVAGMEGALASVIGGLVSKPVLAVPTSVGYGANFGGIAALLSMLNSCASGVSVLNIDNGFGAGYMASMINKL
ncbi:MAG: nickel pincer cofactor biosynthesis protein LarB [Eubacteriaceae bacterium]